MAENGSKNASIVAAAVKKAPSKSGMNAGKFTGGISYRFIILANGRARKKVNKSRKPNTIFQWYGIHLHYTFDTFTVTNYGKYYKWGLTQ